MLEQTSRFLALACLVLFGLLALQPKVSAVDLFPPEVCPDTNMSAVCVEQRRQEGSGGQDPVAGRGGILSDAVNIIALVGGIAAVIIIIYSGYAFVTAGGSIGGQRAGDPNRAKKARETIMSAMIGLVVIALAWVIVRFIIDRLL